MTAVLALLNVSELVASFALVFGFFGLWAGAWLTTAAIWHHWITRTTA